MVRGDERGQVVQIGAILLFAFLILAFSGYQAVLVPQQNAEVEAAHAQHVAADMVSFRSAVVDAWATERPRAATVRLGTDYPPRLVAVNPPPPSGTLRTATAGELTVVAGGTDETRRVCGTAPITTHAVTYTADYNGLQRAPTVVYENTVAYRRFDGTVLFDSDQLLVRNETVNLMPVVTAYSGTGTGARSVGLSPASNAATTITLTSGEQLAVTFPSQLNATTWRDLLADQPNVTSVDGSGDSITVTLEGPPARSGGNSNSSTPGTGGDGSSGTQSYTVACRPIALD